MPQVVDVLDAQNKFLDCLGVQVGWPSPTPGVCAQG